MPSRRLKKRSSIESVGSNRQSLSRLASGQTGLDPVESQKELAFFEGKLLRHFFTGQLRTRSPVYLALILISGVTLVLLVFGFMIFGTANHSIGNDLVTLLGCQLPMLVVGFALLVNFGLNIGLRSSQVKKKSHTH